MIRLIIALLCALGLAFSPVAANAALTPSSSMPGCTMGGEMPDMPADHSSMDCCTPACQAPSAAAFLPTHESGLSEFNGKAKLVWAPSRELVSAPGSGLDPPPRI